MCLHSYQEPIYVDAPHQACTTQGGDTSCSSGTVAGLIFFEVFCYLWTSQVIGNVALATLAGGPYGAWYYYGPREMGQMVCYASFFYEAVSPLRHVISRNTLHFLRLRERPHSHSGR